MTVALGIDTTTKGPEPEAKAWVLARWIVHAVGVSSSWHVFHKNRHEQALNEAYVELL